MSLLYLGGVNSGTAAWLNNAWTYRKSITVNATNVTGTLTNFPVLISRTDSDLQSRALASGYDLVFTAGDGTTKLSHELDSYSNGTVTAWVKVPYLSATSNTVLYLYYGNASAANQQNTSGVWDANYSVVWHLNEVGSGSSQEYKDATSNARAARGRGGIPGLTSGKFGNGQLFNGTSDYIEGESNLGISGNATRTVSFWAKLSSASGSAIAGWGNANNNESFIAGAYGNYWTLAGNGSGNDWTGIAAATTGSWQFHTIVHNGGTARWYVNGAEIGTGFNHTYATSDGKVLLGQATYSGTTYYLNGTLDEVRISNLARSTNWIRTEFANQNSPATFYTVGASETATSQLVISSINGGTSPRYSSLFNVVVGIQNAAGIAQNATTNTVVSLSVASGSGTLSGTLTKTITNGTSTVTFSGLTYSKVENSVALTATRTSGDSLQAASNALFSVTAAPLTVVASSVSRRYGESNPPFSATYTGFVNSDTTNVLSGSPSFSTAADQSSAVGTYTITPAVGTLTAANYSFTTFSNGTLTVSKASSSVNLSAAANPVATGSNVIVTATVSSIAPASGTPTGSVQFRSDGVSLGTAVTLNNGVARLTNSSLSHGTHSITAEYSSDGNFTGSTNVLQPALVVNTAPTAGNDTLQRFANCGVKIRLSSLLTNDVDADGEPLHLISMPAASVNGGTIRTNGDWLFYTPPTGSTNADSFVYGIADNGGLNATGTISINVIANLAADQNTTPSLLANGRPVIHWRGIPGRAYTVLAQGDQPGNSWFTLTNLTANSRGEITFSDPSDAAAARRYRLIYP